MPADPVILHYHIDPSQPPPERPQAWDVEVKMEDLALKAKMTSVTVGAQREGVREIMQIDEKVSHASILAVPSSRLTFVFCAVCLWIWM